MADRGGRNGQSLRGGYSMKSVLLLGSYGQSNLGDDLLMWNYLQLLKDRGFTTIYANANTTDLIPEPVKQAFPGLKIVNTYETSLVDYLQLIRQVDCAVYGGGTLYKELYGSTGRGKYSVIVRMMGFNVVAKLLGTPVYHLNIGIGSLKSALGRWITKRALMAATHTIFRDQKSYDYALETLHIPGKKITNSTDGLFLNHVWEKPWHEANLAIDRTKYDKVVGVNVLSDIPDWVDRAKYIQTIQTFVGELLAAGNYVVLVPFQHAFNPRNDKVFMEDTFAKELGHDNCRLLDQVSIDEITSVLQQCDVFVGMRFHSLLLSLAVHVPFVALAYDTKCWRFVEEINYPHAVELEKLELQSLADHYKAATETAVETKNILAHAAKQLYKEAEETAWNP
jgi:polysaccharide pyruvyl transferase WcaK-like protein